MQVTIPITESALPAEHFAALSVALDPRWLGTIERLSNSVLCVSCQIDQLQERTDERTFVQRCQSLIENLIELVDRIGPDPDLEPSLGWPAGLASLAFTGGNDDREQDDSDDEDGADDEPSLGSHEIREAGAVSYLHHPVHAAGEVYHDGEEEHDGREEETFRCF
jgi:hypothetical protein